MTSCYLLVTLCLNSKGDKAKRVPFISSSQTPPFLGGHLVISSKVDPSNGPCLSKSLLIPSCIDEHLVYFQFGPVINKVATNICVQTILMMYVFISLEKKISKSGNAGS